MALSVLPNSARTTGELVIGQPGVGKSKFLAHMITQDILAGRGVGVLDPHSDLVADVKRRLASVLPTRPELAERVVIIDPTDTQWTAGLNPLQSAPGLTHERMAQYLTDVVVKIWRIDVSNAPRLVWLLKNSFVALMDLGLSLLDLPRFLLDPGFREPLLMSLANESVRTFFSLEFPASPGAAQQWVAPVLNKLGGLLFDPDLRLMLSGKPTINFRDVLDRGLVLLASLPKGIIGEGASALLGAFIVAQFQKAALARADSGRRAPFYLYLDEFQNYTTDNIQDILSESRKYALSLTLAHQYLDQLAPDLRSAVMNTVGSIVCFRVSHHDASRLVREVFPSPDFLRTTQRQVRLERFGTLPILTLHEEQSALGWERLALELANLPPRFFWMRRRGPYGPVRRHSLDLPDLPDTPKLQANLALLTEAAGRRYGRLKSEARRAARGSRSWSQATGIRPDGAAEMAADDEMLRETKIYDQ